MSQDLREVPISTKAWHAVLEMTDHEASDAANIDLLCMLVSFIRPTVIVEAGTYRGHAAMAMANILYQMGLPGVIHTADVIDWGFTETVTEKIPNLWPHLRFHHGEFLEMLEGIPEVDFAYVDASDKENEHLRMDHANAVYDKLNVNGLMLIDDTASLDWGDAQKFQQWSKYGGVHLPQHRGLTIIQKKFGFHA